MGTVVSHEQCPKCAKEGRDRSGDNLARYSDGGAYCFNCGYFIFAGGLSALSKGVQETGKTLSLPGDCSTELPTRALSWLKKYQLTDHDLKLNHVMWSEHYQRIVFPIIINKELVGWVGRSVDPDRVPKALTFGRLHEYTYILGNLASKTIVLVEDLVSAMRVAGTFEYAVCPLSGSHVSTRRMLVLKRYFDEVIVWLDKDKEKESVKFSRKAKEFGINARSVITDLDPKEYTDSEILSYLTNHKK